MGELPEKIVDDSAGFTEDVVDGMSYPGTAESDGAPYLVPDVASTDIHESQLEALLPVDHDLERSISRRAWNIRLVALTTFLSGLVCVVHPLFLRLSAHPKLFTALVPYSTYHWSRSVTSAFGLMLIYLSLNLLRRKRVAWLLSVLITSVSVINLVARIGSERVLLLPEPSFALSLPLAAIMPSIIALILLWRWRGDFTVQSEIRGVKRAIVFVLASIFVAMFYGTAGFWLLDHRDFGISFSLLDSLIRALRELTLIGNSDLSPRTPYGASFLQSLRILGSIAGAFALYSIFRPLEYEMSTLPRERNLAKNILSKHGRAALDYMKLLPDKSYFFDFNQTSFIAYKTARNIAIVLGDPVGPAETLPLLTQQFLDYCHNNGWNVAFMQTTPELQNLYRNLGLAALKIGEDAIVNLDRYCATTIKAKSFKSPIRKFDKLGFKLVRMVPPHSAELIKSVEQVSNAWLSLPGRKERGFSLWRFDRALLQSHTIYVLRDDKDEIIAFVDQIPSYVKGEATIDMMRHHIDVPSGTMDYLFGKLLESLKEQGFTQFSLGLAALSGVGDHPGASVEERAAFLIYNHLNRFFSYKGLRAYKQKFDPEWEDRFLIYEGGPAGLVRTTAALVAAMQT